MLKDMPRGKASQVGGMFSRLKGVVSGLLRGRATPRVLLFLVAVLFKVVASALAGVGFVLNSPLLLILSTVVWVVWFVLLFLVALPMIDQLWQNRMRWLKPVVAIIVTILLLVGLAEAVAVPSMSLESVQSWVLGANTPEILASFESVFAYNDATALCHQATDNLIRGENPYATANVISAMEEFNLSPDKLTPLREGCFAGVFPYPSSEQMEQFWQEASQNPEDVPPEVVSKLSYPAASFLLPAPFVLLGVEDLRLIFLFFILPPLGYVLWRAPRDKRIFLLGALLISLELWNSLAAGETGSLCFPFLLLAWLLPRRHLWLSAIFMGVAVATKQVIWFFLPFYLVMIFRMVGTKKSLSVLSVIAGIFLAANIAFIVQGPMLWVTSLLSPMVDNLFPLGVGVITIVTGGVLEIQSPLVFSILEIGIGVGAFIWYFRVGYRYPHTGLVLAMLPLFFAWRSLWAYFFYADIILLAAVISDYGDLAGQGALPLRSAE